VLAGSAGLDAVSAVITAHEASAVKLLEELKVVVEANQARRKPKVMPTLLVCELFLRASLVVCACDPALCLTIIVVVEANQARRKAEPTSSLASWLVRAFRFGPICGSAMLASAEVL
jgi:hypothetical protein